jgi:hypothetical protein
LPEAARFARTRPDYSAQEHARAALLSAEFQNSIIQLIANAYPEKTRIIHVHIQKTAGLDLQKKLSALFPAALITLSQEEVTSKQAFFETIKAIVGNLSNHNSLVIAGHKELTWYLSRSLYRYGDRMFAVIRHPYDIVISYINFIIGRFVNDPKLSRYDTRDWAGMIGLGDLPDLSKNDNILGIASKLLVTRSTIIRPNFLATYLGKGTAHSALDLIARTDIEITDVGMYKRWLKETWGIESDTRVNQSRPYVTIDSFRASEREYIKENCAEDMILYSALMKALKLRGASYIRGADILG